MTNYATFWGWIDAVRQERGLPWYRVEELGGQGNGVIARRFNDKAEPTLDNMRALSEALNLPIEEVLRQAGVIPDEPEPTGDVTLRELFQLMRGMTPGERRDAFDYLLWHYRRDRVAPGSARDYATTEESNRARRDA